MSAARFFAAALATWGFAAQVDLPARYKTPSGWSIENSGSGADAGVRLTQGSAVMKIRLYGGVGSRFKTPRDFMESFAAGSYGQPPRPASIARVAGAERRFYERVYPLKRVKQVSERFCLVPASGGRFFVLSYAWESPVPDLSGEGAQAWAALLNSFSLKP